MYTICQCNELYSLAHYQYLMSNISVNFDKNVDVLAGGEVFECVNGKFHFGDGQIGHDGTGITINQDHGD